MQKTFSQEANSKGNQTSPSKHRSPSKKPKLQSSSINLNNFLNSLNKDKKNDINGQIKRNLEEIQGNSLIQESFLSYVSKELEKFYLKSMNKSQKNSIITYPDPSI